MKQYEKLTEEQLVDKILRATSSNKFGFGLNHRERRLAFNDFWKIDIDLILNGFNQIVELIKNLDYLNETIVCDFCGKKFTRHERDVQNKSGRHFCSQTCGKKFANSMALTTQRRALLSEKMKTLFKQGKLKIPLNKGVKQSMVDKYMQNPRKCRMCGKVIPYKRRHFWSCCKEHEICGGKRSHSGRGKKGRFHGVWYDSSWELAWMIYQTDHNVKFERCSESFEYEFKGKIHRYHPDFKLSDNSLVEIKGYSSEQWKAKLDSVPKNITLRVLYKDDMKPILDYVIEKYGHDFIKFSGDV